MTIKPKILFLTNALNDSPQEDQLLVDFLSEDFDLIVSHPLDCLSLLYSVEGVIIRNIWPTHEYQDEWEDVKTYLRSMDLPIYNPPMFKGDIEGKDYLVVLYNKGYPVIPSIDNLDYLGMLPVVDDFWIKPKKSCDGIGAERLNKKELLARNPKGYIIQPFMEFECEPSFFFVDNQFSHAICQKHRLLSEDVFPYNPTPADIDFARQFVRWSNLAYGIQRIDAIRTNDGSLLLTEIEDFCPYLYLNEVEGLTMHAFTKAVKTSMQRVFCKRLNHLRFY